jgi:hypothetical protein
LNTDSLNSISKELKAFILILVFLLSTPLGLILNAIGWFIFGRFDIGRINKIASK